MHLATQDAHLLNLKESHLKEQHCLIQEFPLSHFKERERKTKNLSLEVQLIQIGPSQLI
jgi:hypothetical protein